VAHLDALHGDVVDDADDAAGARHGQQRVAGVGVEGPGAGVEVLVCLRARDGGRSRVKGEKPRAKPGDRKGWLEFRSLSVVQEG